MERKGFPESYDTGALLRFLADVKAGKRNVAAPVYSHLVYDIVPGEDDRRRPARHPHLEGLNVLQPARMPQGRQGHSLRLRLLRFLDLSSTPTRTTCTAGTSNRFLRLRHTAFRDPLSYFRRYAELTEAEAIAIADGLWSRINLVEPARKHPADPPARQPDPAQGREPPHRDGGAARL